MKKAVILSILAACCSLGAAAQVGITGGWNMNNYRYESRGVQHSRSSVSGFNIGLFYRVPLSRHFIVEPVLLFSRKGAQNNNTAFPVDYYRNRLDYVELAVPFMYRAPIDRRMDFSIGAGPYAALLAHADVLTNYSNSDRRRDESSIGSGNPDDFSAADAGLRFGAGLRFARSIMLSASYDLGLADIAPQASDEIRTRTFSLNLGFVLR